MILQQKDLSSLRKTVSEHADHLAYQINFFKKLRKNQRKNRKWEIVLTTNKKEITPSRSKVNLVKKIIDDKEINLFNMGEAYHHKRFTAKCETGFLHGIGIDMIQDNGITIHPVYGIPYIPASSVKGLVRSWVNWAFFDGKIDDEKGISEEYQEKAKVFVDVFGDQSKRGLAQFYDIYIPNYKVVKDIISVHFQEYYLGQGKVSPNDYNRVNKNDETNKLALVDFYKINTDEEVNINFTMLKQSEKDTLSGLSSDDLMSLLAEWIEKAFEEFGVGAKTAVGFGKFTDFKDVTESRLYSYKKKLEEKQIAIKKQKELEAKQNLSGVDLLLFEIENLDPNNDQDKQDSKSKIFNDLVKLVGSKDKDEKNKAIEAAEQLKKYWQETGDWKVKGKKQKEKVKVKQLKEILG